MKKALILNLVWLATGISVFAVTPSPWLVALMKENPDQARALMAPIQPAGDTAVPASPFIGPGGQDYRNGHFARHLQELKAARFPSDGGGRIHHSVASFDSLDCQCSGSGSTGGFPR